MIRAGSLFSGIAAPEYASPQLDWRWSAETDPFASAVLAHHYPGVPNLGDVNGIDTDAIEPVDLIVFGSPCQSFSVAGKRLGLDDPRGNMALVGLRVVGRVRPRWVVWENVPGVLSSDEGRDFGTFLGLLGELGYGFAYRVLDAQHFGVPQRRRRVFVIGHLGDWRPAAAVLFEPESLRGDTAPRRETRERVADGIAPCLDAGEWRSPNRNQIGVAIPTADDLTAASYIASYDQSFGPPSDVVPTLQAGGGNDDRGKYNAPIAFSAKDHGADAGEIAPTLRAGTHHRSHANAGVMPAICGTISAENVRHTTGMESGADLLITGTLAPGAHPGGFNGRDAETGMLVITHSLRADGFDAGEERGPLTVRRLTPREAERLQGFPDDYTLVPYRGKPAADGPRYRAIGNSMAVPVIGWILGRIA